MTDEAKPPMGEPVIGASCPFGEEGGEPCPSFLDEIPTSFAGIRTVMSNIARQLLRQRREHGYSISKKCCMASGASEAHQAAHREAERVPGQCGE
jgi:hypothetical protein